MSSIFAEWYRANGKFKFKFSILLLFLIFLIQNNRTNNTDTISGLEDDYKIFASVLYDVADPIDISTYNGNIFFTIKKKSETYIFSRSLDRRYLWSGLTNKTLFLIESCE